MDDQSHSNGIKETEVKSLKILGGIQIGIGIVCVCMSLIGIALDVGNLDKKCTYNYDYYYSGYYYYGYYYGYSSSTCYQFTGLLLAFDISCLLLSGWFILTGLLPVCMTSTRKNKWKCLKISFMVCSIIGAAVFILAVISMGISNALIRAFENDDTTAAIPAVLAIAACIELIVAIISASYCCCGSSWGSQISPATFYIYIRNNDTGVIFGMPVSQIPENYFQSQNMTVIPYNMQQLSAQPRNNHIVHQPGPSHTGAEQGNHQMMPHPGPSNSFSQQENYQMVPQPGSSQQWVQQGNHQMVPQPGPSHSGTEQENHQMVPQPGPSQQWVQKGNHQIVPQPGPSQSGPQQGNHQMMPQPGPSHSGAQQGNHQMIPQPEPSQQNTQARSQVENQQIVVQQGTQVICPQKTIGPEGQMMTQRSFVDQCQTIEPSAPPEDHFRISQKQ